MSLFKRKPKKKSALDNFRDKVKVGDWVIWKRNNLKGIVNSFGMDYVTVSFGEYGIYDFGEWGDCSLRELEKLKDKDV